MLAAMPRQWRRPSITATGNSRKGVPQVRSAGSLTRLIGHIRVGPLFFN